MYTYAHAHFYISKCIHTYMRVYSQGSNYQTHVSSPRRILHVHTNTHFYMCKCIACILPGVKLPDACKLFKKKFSCGASVVETPDNKEEIEIQVRVVFVYIIYVYMCVCVCVHVYILCMSILYYIYIYIYIYCRCFSVCMEEKSICMLRTYP